MYVCMYVCMWDRKHYNLWKYELQNVKHNYFRKLYVCMYVCMYDRHTIYPSKFCSGDVAEIAPTILKEDNGRPYKPVYLPKSRPRWLSWMRRPTGDQEVAGSTPAEVGNILSWRLIMKYFLQSFPPFCWFKKGSCQFLAKEWAQYWLTP